MCEDELNYSPLVGDILNIDTYLWSATSGVGGFGGGQTTPNPTYTFTASDKAAGYVNLTLQGPTIPVERQLKTN